MWRYVVDPACSGCAVVPTALFSAPNHICPGTCTSFNNLSQYATSYLWSFPGANPSTSTDVNPTNICYGNPGNYSVQLIASSATGIDTLTLNNYITVYPYPAPQGILQSGDTLFANAGAGSYQWFLNSVLIPGATNYFYVASASGDYNVVATDGNGCEVEAVIFDVVASSPSIVDQPYVVFPNPVKDKIIIQNAFPTAGKISIYNMIGELRIAVDPSPALHTPFEIDVSKLVPGCYYLELSTNKKVYRSKFIKQ
jgi:hypothetical protein